MTARSKPRLVEANATPSVGYPAHAYNHLSRNIQPAEREPWWKRLLKETGR